MLVTLFAYPIHLLLTYGYTALFIWSLLEGEIGLMLTGWLASDKQYFTYEHIIYIAIAGALIGDHLVYITGRFFAPKAKVWLKAYEEKRVKIQRWFRKYGALVIVFERFIYGTHIPALLTVGISEYPYLKFLFFDIIGTILWAFTFVSVGYYLGDSAIQLILFIQKNILWMLFALFLFMLYRQAKKM